MLVNPIHHNSNIFIPNEIFSHLHSLYQSKQIKSFAHVSFAYSYYFLINYLYRYSLFQNKDGTYISQKDIKAFLGINPLEKRVDYIIKKDGLLDQIGYTSSTTNLPVLTLWDGIYEQPYFITLEEYNQHADCKINIKNNKIKFPILAFHRDVSTSQRHGKMDVVHDHELTEISNGEFTGTFFDTTNCHSINLSVFADIFENSELSCSGFYIYSFLKYSHRFRIGGYKSTLDKFSSNVCTTKPTLLKYLGLLEDYDFIGINRKDKNQVTSDTNIYTMLR